MVPRQIEKTVVQLARQFPVITLTGPRQSGKTTLAQKVFSDYLYVSMENPDQRERALADPVAFLKVAKQGMIIDEIQRSPELLSYIQGIADRNKKSGQFVLTGSHQFDLMNSITQSLAGRTAILKLLPFTFHEAESYKPSFRVDDWLLHGFYPGVYNNNQNPTIAYRSYFETYIERDLRQIINIKDLRLFRKFVRLCAGRIGQLLSANSLASDVGVSVPTIQSWISVLEESFIIMLLEPYHANIGKRLIKSPKLYFYDTGLAAYLLGLESPDQVSRDPLKGNLFENMVLAELVKQRFNHGLDHNCYFFRDSNGNEVDILYMKGNSLVPVEIKSSETFHADFFKGLDYIKNLFPEKTKEGYVVYSGSDTQKGDFYHLLNAIDAGKIIHE